MKERIEQALRLKNRARAAREDDDPERATQLIEDACRRLEALWKEREAIINQGDDAIRPEDRDLVYALAEIHGVRGGIYRSRKMYDEAANAYDRGLDFEAHRARKADSSYNLVQRLINRALLVPEKIGSSAWTVKGVEMWAELQDTERLLSEQLRSSRARDPWAVADQLFVRLLLSAHAEDGGRAITEAWSALEGLAPKSFVYESTRRALEDLRNAMKTVPDSARLSGGIVVQEALDRLIEQFQDGEQRARGR